MVLIIRGVIGVVLIGSFSGSRWVGTLMGMPKVGEIHMVMDMAEYEMEATL